MSSSEIVQEILEFKTKIEKDLKVNNIILIILNINRMIKQLSKF